tara:strand:- start:1807 stop:2034 length:228 start_codon:yes stop_codon:yes gene_type:complete
MKGKKSETIIDDVGLSIDVNYEWHNTYTTLDGRISRESYRTLESINLYITGGKHINILPLLSNEQQNHILDMLTS